MCFYLFRASLTNNLLRHETTCCNYCRTRKAQKYWTLWIFVICALSSEGVGSLHGVCVSCRKVQKCIHTIRTEYQDTPEFVQQVQNIIEANPGTSVRVIGQRFSRAQSAMLCMRSFGTIHTWWGKDKWFRHTHTQEQQLLRVKRLLNLKLKYPQNWHALFYLIVFDYLFFSDKKQYSRKSESDKWHVVMCRSSDVPHPPMSGTTGLPLLWWY